MPDLPGTTRAQTIFLRACSSDPFGLSGREWPTPTTFRRWMRRPGFRRAIQAVRDSLRMQCDLQLAAASAAAMQAITRTLIDNEGTVVSDEQIKQAKESMQYLTTLLRLAHLRQRFAVDPAPPPRAIKLPPEVSKTVDELRKVAKSFAHPSLTVAEARRIFQSFEDAQRAVAGDKEIDRNLAEDSERPDRFD